MEIVVLRRRERHFQGPRHPQSDPLGHLGAPKMMPGRALFRKRGELAEDVPRRPGGRNASARPARIFVNSGLLLGVPWAPPGTRGPDFRRLPRLFSHFSGSWGRSCARRGSREGSEGLWGAFRLHFWSFFGRFGIGFGTFRAPKRPLRRCKIRPRFRPKLDQILDQWVPLPPDAPWSTRPSVEGAAVTA